MLLSMISSGVLNFALLVGRVLGETVSLCNCNNNGKLSAQIAFFSSEPSGLPGNIATQDHVTWAGDSSMNGTFVDGNFSASNIGQVPEGEAAFKERVIAGSGTSKQCPWVCFKNYIGGLSKEDRTMCSQIYDCKSQTAIDEIGLLHGYW